MVGGEGEEFLTVAESGKRTGRRGRGVGIMQGVEAQNAEDKKGKEGKYGRWFRREGEGGLGEVLGHQERAKWA